MNETIQPIQLLWGIRSYRALRVGMQGFRLQGGMHLVPRLLEAGQNSLGHTWQRGRGPRGPTLTGAKGTRWCPPPSYKMVYKPQQL